MRMLTSTSRRFTRRNDYRLGTRVPGGVRTKDRIRMARPEPTRGASPAREVHAFQRDQTIRSQLSSAA